MPSKRFVLAGICLATLLALSGAALAHGGGGSWFSFNDWSRWFGSWCDWDRWCDWWRHCDDVVTVPEPSLWILLAMTGGAVAAGRRMRCHAS